MEVWGVGVEWIMGIAAQGRPVYLGGLGFRVYSWRFRVTWRFKEIVTNNMENQMESNMENQVETVNLQGYIYIYMDIHICVYTLNPEPSGSE